MKYAFRLRTHPCVYLHGFILDLPTELVSCFNVLPLIMNWFSLHAIGGSYSLPYDRKMNNFWPFVEGNPLWNIVASVAQWWYLSIVSYRFKSYHSFQFCYLSRFFFLKKNTVIKYLSMWLCHTVEWFELIFCLILFDFVLFSCCFFQIFAIVF